MRWRRVREEDEDSIRRFLSDREDLHVAAASRFLERDRRRDRTWLGADAEIQAFAFLGSGGALLPVFAGEDSALGRCDHARRAIARCLGPHRVRSIQAIADDASIAEDALARLGRTPSESIDYILMGLDGTSDASALGAGPADLVVRRARREDADALFPLQAAYEREEVIPVGVELNLASCRLGLERSLATRIALLAEFRGEIVGKANTNARSYARDQIGGVYVLASLRGRGIGTRLVAELVKLIAEGGRASTLFVKKRNAAAIAAYRNVGFDVRGDYRISYY